MKVVLFCGGLGTRIREYSESIPKPMIPVGHQPILWHVMQYYSEYGHTDFILTLGYKVNIIKEFFLNYRPQVYTDCVVSGFGANVELLSKPEEDWRVSPIDTGIWRNSRRAPVGRARLREERGDVPRELQRRSHGRESRRRGPALQAER
jgi:glucose-1-phosphate cytidylyltransferase